MVADGRPEVLAAALAPGTTRGETMFSPNSESTYDRDGRQWTVPIDAGVSQGPRMRDQLVYQLV